MIAVRCQIGGLEFYEHALLDTACTWTVLNSELAEEIKPALGMPLQSVEIDTRRGLFQGNLHRTPIRLIASIGLDLSIDATVAVLDAWDGPTVLGFRGCLDHVRIALDPGNQFRGAMLSFGRC
jgi:hypothetical protein